MARSNRSNRNSALTSSGNGNLERQAKRLARQQKRLEGELLAGMGQQGGGLTGVKGRPITLNNLKRLEPLTDTQADFFDAYEENNVDGYVLYGQGGTGKCQGEKVEVNIIVSDELYETLIKMG